MQKTYQQIRNIVLGWFRQLELLVRRLPRLMKRKTQPAPQMPKIVVPPLKAPEQKPQRVAKTFVKPDDPYFRYGSSYLTNLMKKRQSAQHLIR